MRIAHAEYRVHVVLTVGRRIGDGGHDGQDRPSRSRESAAGKSWFAAFRLHNTGCGRAHE
jgi:hypothetical protein